MTEYVMLIRFLLFFILFANNATQSAIFVPKKDNHIIIKNAKIRAVKNNTYFATLYFSMNNQNVQTDFLTKVETEISEYTSIQKTVIENNIAKIIKVTKVAAPGNVKVEFSPGAIHLMLFQLKKPLTKGDKVQLKLFFQNDGVIESTATVM